jgi:hypothetical protein
VGGGPSDTTGHEDDTDTQTVPTGCGVLMGCGTALKSGTGPVTQELPPRLDEAPVASVGKPTAADLSLDTPPPRRHA